MTGKFTPILAAGLAALAATGCSATPPATGAGIPDELLLLLAPPPPEIIVMERPIFRPPPDPPDTPDPAASGERAVRESNLAGIRPPGEFSYAAMIFDFNRDWVYEIFTSPLRITNITLEPGERITEPPFVSDSERWILGAGVSHRNGVPVQHVYVKPTAVSLEATLIVNTDRRVYHLILRSFRDVHMPIVRWRYPATMPMNLVAPRAGESAIGGTGAGPGVTVDPRFVSFNYRIRRGLSRRPPWMPEMVLDDGRRTIIVFPESVLHREFPAIFGNRRDVVNYRVDGRVVVIDGLFETITVTSGRTRVTITKRRG